MEPYQLTATQASNLIRKGKLSCEELTRSTLARVEECDSKVKAWSYIDANKAMRNARELDKSAPLGELHGLTLGVKDVIDTADMPTSYNSPLYFDHRPSKDAACVAILRQQGIQILGKTETAEFAAGGRFPNTCNASNLLYSPGASSAGSAAAVGAGMVQLALGTQTGSSLMRPATYNGVYAFKPTYGLLSTEGTKMFAPSLDTIGWYGRSVDDLALMAQAYRIYDPALGTGVRLNGLRVGLCRGPNWNHIESGGEAVVMEAARRLMDAGAHVEEIDLPSEFERITAFHKSIMQAEGSVSFYNEFVMYRSRLNESLRALVEQPRKLTDLFQAQDEIAPCRRLFDSLFNTGVDVVLTPAAAGEAPLLASEEQGTPTNAMVFCGMWTALHVPCVAVPVGTGKAGLPLGVQLVGPRGGDSRLLLIAKIAAEALDRGEPVHYK